MADRPHSGQKKRVADRAEYDWNSTFRILDRVDSGLGSRRRVCMEKVHAVLDEFTRDDRQLIFIGNELHVVRNILTLLISELSQALLETRDPAIVSGASHQDSDAVGLRRPGVFTLGKLHRQKCLMFADSFFVLRNHLFLLVLRGKMR